MVFFIIVYIMYIMYFSNVKFTIFLKSSYIKLHNMQKPTVYSIVYMYILLNYQVYVLFIYLVFYIFLILYIPIIVYNFFYIGIFLLAILYIQVQISGYTFEVIQYLLYRCYQDIMKYPIFPTPITDVHEILYRL